VKCTSCHRHCQLRFQSASRSQFLGPGSGLSTLDSQLPTLHSRFSTQRVVSVAAANGNAPCGCHSSGVYHHADPLIDCIWPGAATPPAASPPSCGRPLPGHPLHPEKPCDCKSATRKTRNTANIVLNTRRGTWPDSPLLLLPLHSEKSCPLI